MYDNSRVKLFRAVVFFVGRNMESKQKNQNISPAAAAAASAVIMGLGQVLNKNIQKAVLFFLVPVLCVCLELITSDWGRYMKLCSRGDSLLSEQKYDYSLEDLQNDASENLNVQSVSQEQASNLASILGIGSDEEDEFGSEEDLWGDSSMGEAYTKPTYVYPNYSLSPEGKKYVLRDFGGFFTRGMWSLVTLGRVVIGDKYAGQEMPLYDKTTRWLVADNSSLLLGNGILSFIVSLIVIALWVLNICDAYSARKKINEGQIESFAVFIKRLWQNAYVYIMLIPAIILILFFTLIPFLYTFLIAFTNYTYKIKLGAMLISWDGFNAFKNAVIDPSWLSVFAKIFGWTILWAVMSSFTVYAIGFINALIVESPVVKGRKVWRMIMVLPWAIPALISLTLFKNAFNKDGLINQILFATDSMKMVTNFLYHIGLEGRPDEPIFWLDPTYNGNLAKAIVILVNLWLGAPYHMMLIIGVLSTISRDLYEACDIDGANAFQRFKTITLPSVLSATIPSLIMTFSFNFNNFGAIYFLTQGRPLWDTTKIPESMRVIGSSMPGQTDILISWIYKLSFTKSTELFNIASVYTIFIFLIVGGFSVFNLQRSKSFSEED